MLSTHSEDGSIEALENAICNKRMGDDEERGIERVYGWSEERLNITAAHSSDFCPSPPFTPVTASRKLGGHPS